MTKKKLRKIQYGTKQSIEHPSLINQHYNTMSSPDNSKTLFNLHVKYDTRKNVTHAGFYNQNKQTLITNNSIHK